MGWHRLSIKNSDLTRFMNELVGNFEVEIAAGRLTRYALFAQKRDELGCDLYIPPGAAFLFDRLPGWKARLKPCEALPDLKGAAALPLVPE
jgi:hypothetical protein